MNKKEKKELARKLLKRNDGYSDEEIEKILGYAFDGKKAPPVTYDSNNRPESA